MKCNVAPFLSELPNVIISDFKTYFQLTSSDMLVPISHCFFLKNDTDAENCCLENFLVLKSESLRASVGSWKVTIYKFSGNAVQEQNIFSNTEEMQYEVTSY